jgi:hypothetical protein
MITKYLWHHDRLKSTSVMRETAYEFCIDDRGCPLVKPSSDKRRQGFQLFTSHSWGSRSLLCEMRLAHLLPYFCIEINECVLQMILPASLIHILEYFSSNFGKRSMIMSSFMVFLGSSRRVWDLHLNIGHNNFLQHSSHTEYGLD